MKKKLVVYLKKTIDWLQKQYAKLTKEEGEPLPYTSLSPIDNAEIDNDYRKSLDWALKNKKKYDIKNIALTGPNGSGKSSILKTYVASYKGDDFHFLNISLATFKEEDGEITPKADLLRLIELSILQQIFYHEEDKKIPDSRFRKIKNYTRKNLLVTTSTVFLLFVAIFHLMYPSLLELLLKIEFNSRVSHIIHYLSFTLIVIGGMTIIYKSIRVLSSIKINKLNIQNAELGIDESVNKSILNHHIDEILYFFEVTDYNVVIIEDLDRFKQTEIFTKLREINLLINSSKKVKKDVVFIYAVRDDMFKEENERTKFFDFIIPVIPIINPSNSGQKLLEKQTQNNYPISENLIDSISLFIDDMRLLNNISNEYYLYRQKLNKNLNQDKLLAIMVYKNIFPNDFTLLSNDKGVLFRAINDKQKYIIAETTRLNDEIDVLKSEIEKLENLKIKDISELRYLYLLFYIPSLPGFTSFNVNGADQSLSQMVSDLNFEYLKSNQAQYSFRSNYQSTNRIPVKFIQIEKQVDSSQTYSERSKLIEDWNNNKAEMLKTEMAELESDKSQVRNLKIRELIEKGHVEINIPNAKQKNLVNVMLRNEFIDEDYLDYVSIFYVGSLTQNDYQFLVNLKSRVYTEFDYKLLKVDNLIKKINPLEFNKEYTLNYTLLDFVINNKKYIAIRDAIITKLQDESRESIKFIDGFVEASTSIQAFISQLIRKWVKIWNFIEYKSSFTQEKKDKYFKLIVEHGDVDDIASLYNNSSFKECLLQKKDFLAVIGDVEKLKSLVKSLNIKFIEVEFDETSAELLDYIYEGNFYEVNTGMIKLMLKAKEKLNQIDFAARNYYAIVNSGCDKLKNYIDANINDYAEKVYLKLDTNNQEDQDCLISLLNSEELLIESKVKIVKQVQTIVKELPLIHNLEMIELFFKENKVDPTWQNVFYYFENNDKKISEFLISFLEIEQNASALSKVKIEMDVEGESRFTTFITILVSTEEIKNEIYELLLKSVPYSFTYLDFSNMSERKIRLLIEYGILVFNSENYKLLKETFTDLHIVFIEGTKAEFIKDVSNYELDTQDIQMLLKSSKISIQEKNLILEAVEESVYSSDQNSLKIIGELILKDNSFRVSDVILRLIIVDNLLSIEHRIRIFNWKHSQISNDYIDAFLNALLEPYSDITINGKRPLISNTEYNKKMVDILESKEYISSHEIEEKGIRVSTFRK